MKVFIFLLISLLSSEILAKRFEVSIESIDHGKKGEPHLIMMSDGRVGYLDSSDKKSLGDIELIKSSREIVEIELSDKHRVLSMRSIEHKKQFPSQTLGLFEQNVSYKPTLITLTRAGTAFGFMRRDYQNDSQCYNRAHIWAYEEFQRTALRSMKVFMFFTRRYIRNYNYLWWFHVTPAVLTSYGLRTLDRRYTTILHSLKSWSDRFVRSKRACPVVAMYKDYSLNQETEDCYHISVSMYFWQPRDIEYRDNNGSVKTSFIPWEINHSYWEAF